MFITKSAHIIFIKFVGADNAFVDKEFDEFNDNDDKFTQIIIPINLILYIQAIDSNKTLIYLNDEHKSAFVVKGSIEDFWDALQTSSLK